MNHAAQFPCPYKQDSVLSYLALLKSPPHARVYQATYSYEHDSQDPRVNHHQTRITHILLIQEGNYRDSQNGSNGYIRKDRVEFINVGNSSLPMIHLSHEEHQQYAHDMDDHHPCIVTEGANVDMFRHQPQVVTGIESQSHH